MQVLLVTGGYDGNRLDSTELLLPSATSWSYSAPLPSPRYLLRGATLDNKVLMTGTWYFDIIHHELCCCKFYNLLLNAGGDGISGVLNHILEYDNEKQLWNTVGTMTVKRSEHAVSVINYNSIKDYCNWKCMTECFNNLWYFLSIFIRP